MADDKSISRPAPPTTQQVPAPGPVPELSQPQEPMSMDEYYQSYLKYFPAIMNQQLKFAPQQTAANVYAQQQLMQGAFAEQTREAPISAWTQYQLDANYMPAYTQMYNTAARTANPQFFDVYGQLGASVGQELGAGYDLGPGLTRELEQSIRGAQTARGNIMGNAPTAQEAFGKGAASIDLYNQRVQNAQNFLQGKQPTDFYGALSVTRPTPMVNQPYYPSTDYVSGASTATTQTAATATSAQSSYNTALQQYNANLIGGYSAYNTATTSAATVNNKAILDQYNAASDYWMYDEAVKHGLYSTPQTGGGGGMMGGMGGTAIAGIGTGLSTGIGLAAAGAGTGTAIAGGAAAAVSAAGAAICWLARRCIPDRWEEFQHWLFTKASDKLRRLYIFRARRLAREVSDMEAFEIGALMEAVL